MSPETCVAMWLTCQNGSALTVAFSRYVLIVYKMFIDAGAKLIEILPGKSCNIIFLWLKELLKIHPILGIEAMHKIACTKRQTNVLEL